MKNRKTEKRPLIHAGAVFVLVLAAAALLTGYMERTAIQQERDRMTHIAQSIGSETYETLLSEMGKTRVLEAYLIQTGGSYQALKRWPLFCCRRSSYGTCCSLPAGVVEAVYPLAGNEDAVGTQYERGGRRQPGGPGRHGEGRTVISPAPLN